MQHKNQGFFQTISERQITGKQSLEKKQAILLINTYKDNRESNPELALACLREIKKLALANVKQAINFFKYSMLFTQYLWQRACLDSDPDFNSIPEINEAFNYAYKDIGILHKNPEFLCEAYYRLANFRSSDPILHCPNIPEAFNLLISASRMEGKDATFASFSLAFLYSSEIETADVYVTNNFSFKFCSLSQLHHFFSVSMTNLSSEKKQMLKQTKKIDLDLVRKQGEITFAEMGCKQAIENLVQLYSTGNMQLNIKQDLEKSAEWQTKLNDLPNFLKKKYQEYFEIAYHNTIKYGYCCSEGYGNKTYSSYNDLDDKPEIDLNYFIKYLCRVENNFDLVDQYHTKFRQEANSGNNACCFYLASNAAVSCDSVLAKKWYTKILENDHSKPNEIILATRSLYEISKMEKSSKSEKIKLLEKAADLNCCESLMDLGKIYLKNDDLENAKKYFDILMKHLSSIPFLYQTRELFMKDKRLMPYLLQVLGEEIKRTNYVYLNWFTKVMNFVEKMDDESLSSSWKEIQNQIEKEHVIDEDVINHLVEKTINEIEQKNLEKQMREHRM